LKGFKILNIVFVFTVFLPSALLSQGSWERIDIPTNDWLRSVWFVDSLYGWAAGNGGTIIHTSDGGESWSVQQSQTSNNIADIFFLDRQTGWATSFNFTQSPYGTVILKTTDGGEEWTQQLYPEENYFMNCILFLDSLTGWMGGSPHALVKSTDGGQSWQQAYVDTSTLAFFPVLKIEFCDENYGYASGGLFDIAGVIWRTWDGGDHWYAIDPLEAPADEVRGLYCFDSLHVMGAGGDPDFGFGVGIITTEDGGLNWEYDELGYPGNAYDLDFRNGTEAWAPLGPRRKFIYTVNGGKKWAEVLTPDSTIIFDVCFPDSLHGFAVGPEGAMLRYTPPLPVGVAENSLPDTSEFLLRIYPNPTRGVFDLQFTVYCLQRVSLKIFDLRGQELVTVLDRELPAGEHRVRFDAGQLMPGVYLLEKSSVISRQSSVFKLIILQ
jgi:photosystem II stability/assembly factor-like uncharacterized protein